MSVRSDVQTEFDNVIKRKFASMPDIMRFLLNHENKPLIIQNLCEQIEVCERISYSLKFNAAVYKKSIESLTNLFCQLALDKKEQDLISRAERQRREKEANRIKEAQEIMQDLEDEVLDTRLHSLPGRTTSGEEML